MTDSQLSPSNEASVQIRQQTSGESNQTIGQVLGGLVVYGQVIYNTPPEPLATAKSKALPEHLGSNPYRGLLAFQEVDGERFFGRERQITALWEKLRQLQESTSAIRLLPIYGPSGSGKSSLARAGLIPELSRRPLPGYDRARVVSFMPGTHPIEALAAILARMATSDPMPVTKTREFAQELAQTNKTGEYDGLRRIVDVLPETTLRPLVVLVDQLEEVYTLCKDPQVRDAFVRTLLDAARDAARHVTVIVTLRSDFLGATQKHPQLNQLIAEQGFFVSAMGAEELRDAIRKPAELAGYSLDEATINLLVNDTEGREGALPLLQFALTRIWEGLPQKPPAQTLEEIGGVGGALAGEAQRIFATLSPEEQKITRRVFLGLVQLGEGTKDTRRRALVDGLLSHQEQAEQVKAVIQRFAEPGVRLITLAGNEQTETAEVTHEALFEHWQQLQTWLEGSRSDLRFGRRLEEAARYWQTQGKPEGSLWRPPDLDLLRQYQQRAGDDLTPIQMEFAQASTAAEDQRLREKERQQHFQKRATIGLTGLTLGALAFGAYALEQSYWVQRQRVELLTANAKMLMTSQPIDGAVNAIAAVGFSQSPVAGFPDYSVPVSVYEGLSLAVDPDNQGQNLLQGHTRSVSSVAFSPDGEQIVSGSWDGTIRFWDAQTLQAIGKPLQYGAPVNSVAYSPDGKRLISGSENKTLRLWDTLTGKPIGQPLQGHMMEVLSVAFSPDGRRIVSGSLDKTLRLWDALTGKPIGQPLQGHMKGVLSVAYSPDGKRIVSGGWDGTIQFWDALTGQPLGQPIQHKRSVISVPLTVAGERMASDYVTSVAFSPDGKRIVSGSSDRTIRLWDALTGKPIGKPMQANGPLINSVAFSPDGKRIVSGNWNHTVQLWDAQTQQLARQLLERQKEKFNALQLSLDGTGINSVAFSPNGKLIVSGGSDKKIRLWDVSWQGMLAIACNRLRNHPALNNPPTDTAKKAKETCENFVWNQQK